MSRPESDSGGNAPSNQDPRQELAEEDADVRRLFERSAYSNPFWSDTIDNESLEDLRNETRRRRIVHGHSVDRVEVLINQRRFLRFLCVVSVIAYLYIAWGTSGGVNSANGRPAGWCFGAILVTAAAAWKLSQKVIQAGTVYPCENIRARSVARFQRWLEGLRLKDPQQHESIVNWLREEELGAERERHRQEATLWAKWERFERIIQFMEMFSSRSIEVGANEQPQMDNEANSGIGTNWDRGHDYEGDRRRAEANEQARQEASRSSGPTCVFCNQPGIASTASGWMCGIHAQGLL